ncbi:MAG: Glu/Leu/Phe/Val dehydrogenase [Sphingopyxis sp.]|nr:Glu/Leu/Phe/Val dehydrogenase [Sphingopyxis sp.]
MLQYPVELPHEAVHLFHDDETGLRAVVAIHSTALGPAIGGCRVQRYASESDATRDALRLSEAMTYKNALAGLDFGGGKAVIMLPDDGAFDRPKLFAAFGRCVQSLCGRFVTAEDAGSTVADMQAVARTTPHVAGLPQRANGLGGDPSPWTARGVFLAMRAAVAEQGGGGLDGAVVGVQGLGHVGMVLADLLNGAGAKLLVSDIDETRVAHAVARFGAERVAPDKIVTAPMDILAPCALGGAIDTTTVHRVQARLICGGANNQLAHPALGLELARRGILYAPDYLVNAGGIIAVCAEYRGGDVAAIEAKVADIGPRLVATMRAADQHGGTPNLLVDRQARRIVAEGWSRRRAA